jgi:hypothetical protein
MDRKQDIESPWQILHEINISKKVTDIQIEPACWLT